VEGLVEVAVAVSLLVVDIVAVIEVVDAVTARIRISLLRKFQIWLTIKGNVLESGGLESVR
jgi:hypothetical protein